MQKFVELSQCVPIGHAQRPRVTDADDVGVALPEPDKVDTDDAEAEADPVPVEVAFVEAEGVGDTVPEALGVAELELTPVGDIEEVDVLVEEWAAEYDSRLLWEPVDD